MTELHEAEIDGVRCFWVDSGRPTLVGSLLFRHGTADETFHQSGWLHMLEHLALHGRGGGALSVNGSVSLLVTTFDCHGPAEAVCEHLTATAAWLSEPTFDELPRELGVLRAESGLRRNPVSRALTWRYGARGPGLAALGEPGLGRASAEELTKLAHRVFNRANAVAVFDGPPPAGLRLRLPAGAFLPSPPAEQCDDPRPAAYVDQEGVVLSGVVSRSVAGTMAPSLLQRALKEKLRDTEGAAYAPWSHYEPVDRSHATLFAGSDVTPAVTQTLVPTVLALVADLDRDGPDPAHLAEHVEAMVQGLSDPYNAAALAFRAAHAVFEEREPQSMDEILEEARALDVEAVAVPLREFAASLLMGVPGWTRWNDELPMLRQPKAAKARGTRFRHQDWPASRLTLTVGPDAVQVLDGDVVRSIAIASAVGLHTYADGRRTLTDRDGWTLDVDPAEWHDGHAAVSLLDATVPADLHLPHPAPPHSTTPPRVPALRRWWLGFRRMLQSRTALAVAIVLMGAALMSSLVFRRGSGAIAFALLLYYFVKEWRSGRRSDKSGG